MKPSSDLDRLTLNMAQRQKDYSADPPPPDCSEPYILFLGAGCSQAAGVPTIEEIARKELSRPVVSGSVMPPPSYDEADQVGSLKRFYKWLETMSAGQVFRLFQTHYANTPVPLFYQDLALLIKKKYFNRILTTNFDTLLEQALSGAGLVPDVDFEVISFGLTSRPSESRRAPTQGYESSPDRPHEPVSIVKLHGDLAEGQLVIAPWQIEDSLKSRRRAAKQELKGDLVMVGYQFESPLLNDWLSSYRKRELWWVSAEPQQGHEEIGSWGEDIASISGDVGRPEEFFGQLSLRLRLLRLPAQSSQQAVAEIDLGFESAPADDPDTAPSTLADNEEVLSEDLRGQIRRFQTSLYSLEQKASPDERPTSLQVQINYQKQQLMALEDKLRSLSTNAPRLLDLLQTMTDNLQMALDDPEVEQRVSGATVNFLRHQFEAVQEQYSSDDPNQQIISAAVGAAAILAERLLVELGATVIKPEEVRDLASFVPTVATRGIK